ncbi:hypothetical protein A7K91_08385 [Paenibacillus oryzae]|uniref:Uncharacterized protein n=1 Tax=Paenibacillus oryzae TaxID=1844972 RepID=A0A1A5YQG9_9BACL|nr:hypothetical protein A7K91_08385 [Paenibacillus oryzae]
MGYYLEQCNEHIQFSIKVSTLSLGGLLGETNSSEGAPGKEVESPDSHVDGYKVADADDMNFLAQLL